MPGSNRDDTLVPAMVRAARRRGYAGRFVLVSQIVVVIALMIMFVVGITGGVLTWGLSGGGDPGNDLIQSFSNALGAFVVLLLFVVLAVASYVALWIAPFLIALHLRGAVYRRVLATRGHRARGDQ